MSEADAAHSGGLRLGFRPCPHEELLLLCMRAVRDPRQEAHLNDLMARPDLDWTRFWALADEQEVQPLAARVLIEHGWDMPPPEAARTYARTIRLRTLAANLSMAAELERIAQTLHRCGIPVVPLKGVHLARRLYGGLDARRIGDIDVLAPEERLEEARAAVRSLGYRLYEGTSHGAAEHTFHGVPFVREAAGVQFVLELHWGLTDPRFATIDYGELWRRVLSYSPERDALRPLPIEETLLYLALHLPKHPTGVLRLLADIDRLLRKEAGGLDWGYVLQQAGRWSVTTLLYFALVRCRMLLDTPVPSGVLEACRPPRWRRALVGALTAPRAVMRPSTQGPTRYSRSQLAYCAMIDPLERCLRAYREYLFLPAQQDGTQAQDRVVGAVETVSRGLARTALAVGSVMIQRWNEPQASATCRAPASEAPQNHGHLELVNQCADVPPHSTAPLEQVRVTRS